MKTPNPNDSTKYSACIQEEPCTDTPGYTPKTMHPEATQTLLHSCIVQ